MASSEKIDSRIANALNSARGANIFDAGDNEALEELVTEYFVRDLSDEEEFSDGEDSGSDLEPVGDVRPAHTHTDDASSDFDDDDAETFGLDTSMPSLEIDIDNVSDMNRDTERAKVEAFGCAVEIKYVGQRVLQSALGTRLHFSALLL
jgi:hypothetical protein